MNNRKDRENYAIKIFVQDMLQFDKGRDQSYSVLLENLDWLQIKNACIYMFSRPILHLYRENFIVPDEVFVKAILKNGEVAAVPLAQQREQTENLFSNNGTLLYLDEIQYFNKKQQQSLLEFMENGKLTLIASTTENPYFCVYNAILSRSSVFEFKSVEAKDCVPTLRRAIDSLNAEFSTSKRVSDDILLYIGGVCGGDIRMGIGVLENAYYISHDEIRMDTVDSLLPSVVGHFDRNGDVHYDLLSCPQKSIRGSDPDAAVFYLAKLLANGDILSVTRRLQVIASEDVGCAYPQAAIITRACCESAKELGMPEAVIPLANAVCILATAPKSNSAYAAYHAAKADIDAGRGIEIPEHLRSPLFKGYLYPHDYENNYVEQTYLPRDLIGRRYYSFGGNKTEQAAKTYYDFIRNAAKKPRG